MMKEFLIGCVCAWLLPLVAQTRWLPPFGESYTSVRNTLHSSINPADAEFIEIADKVIIVQHFSLSIVCEFDSAGCYGMMTEQVMANRGKAQELFESAIDDALSSGAVTETSDSVAMYERHFVGIRPDQVYFISLDQTGNGAYTVRKVYRKPSLMPLQIRDNIDVLALKQ